MAVLTKRLGPADHGRRMSYEEFRAADYRAGHKYELIRGRLYVSVMPRAPQGLIEKWVSKKLDRYTEERPDIINFVYNKACFLVPEGSEVSAPEPDIAAYHNFPLDLPFSEIQWDDLVPLLVVEVVSEDDPAKDFRRNVNLYLQVTSIKEYWILDNREDADRPTLHVYRRVGKRWRVSKHAYGETYTTKLLPGFELIIDPRR